MTLTANFKLNRPGFIEDPSTRPGLGRDDKDEDCGPRQKVKSAHIEGTLYGLLANRGGI